LQGKHLAPRLWADRNAVSDGMPQQWRHRIIVHRIRGKIAVLHISFQQTLVFQKAANTVGDGVRQLGEFGACRRPGSTEPVCSIGRIDIHPIEEQHVKMDKVN
jgi:hypothetical protein